MSTSMQVVYIGKGYVKDENRQPKAPFTPFGASGRWISKRAGRHILTMDDYVFHVERRWRMIDLKAFARRKGHQDVEGATKEQLQAYLLDLHTEESAPAPAHVMEPVSASGDPTLDEVPERVADAPKVEEEKPAPKRTRTRRRKVTAKDVD